nr:TetR/AcrR family transcriptional regulator [Neptunicoccus sediminis]
MLGALDELLAEKPFRDISVSDLARRARIGRQTFYRHFDSIGAMLELRLNAVLSGQMEWAAANAENLSPQEWSYKVHLFAFEQVASLPHIAHAILSGEAGKTALGSFQDQIIALRDALPAAPPPCGTAELQQFLPSFYAGAIVSVLLKWVESGCTPDAATMARFMAQMTGSQKA